MTSQEKDFSAWIGRTSEGLDAISERLLGEFAATLHPHVTKITKVPPGIHWCLAPDMRTADQLGADGHARLGLSLPEIGLPRRMWAGGELAFHGEFAAGDMVRKTSTIEDISFKTGKSGRLCFFTMRHHYRVGDRLMIDERQDIVYREPSTMGASAPVSPAKTAAKADAWIVTSNSTLLFRYSAMTFNGHRIHYDAPYAREVEGYDGLVVHGPMQATFMLNMAVGRLGRLPRRFRYRGLAPLICAAPFAVDIAPAADGGFETRVIAASGIVTMSGLAD